MGFDLADNLINICVSVAEKQMYKSVKALFSRVMFSVLVGLVTIIFNLLKFNIK